MRIKKKVIFLLIIVFFIIFSVSLLLSNFNRGALKGNIVVWTNEVYYNYFIKTAEEFEENNKKVNVKVVNIENEQYLDRIINSNEKDLPNIVQLDFMEIEEIKEKIDFFQENKYIIETYSKNFKDSRIQEVKIDDNYYGVPFESNPIALYVRADILNKYGYEAAQLNTWNDLIKIGVEINAKSSGQVNMFSKDDKSNIELLITSQLADYQGGIYTKEDILNEINKIYKEEFITEDSNSLYRIASLDFYKDIIQGNSLGVWECKNPPSYKPGENRMYDIGGKNLVALNTYKNREAVKEFISFASTNKDLLSKELLNINFFPSSLYSLNVSENKLELRNIKGGSPFLILINIVERAPSIKNYDKVKEVIRDLYIN